MAMFLPSRWVSTWRSLSIFDFGDSSVYGGRSISLVLLSDVAGICAIGPVRGAGLSMWVSADSVGLRGVGCCLAVVVWP